MRRSHCAIFAFAFALATCSCDNRALAQAADPSRQKRISASMALLEHGGDAGEAEALSQLIQLSLPPEQGVPLLRAYLVRRTLSVSESLAITHAVEGLAQYGAAARPALPDLIRLLDDVGTDNGERTNGIEAWWWLTRALASIDPNDPGSADALKRALSRGVAAPGPLAPLIGEAADALGQMGPPAHAAVPILVQAMEVSPNSAGAIAGALSRLMPEGAIAVPAMARALDSGIDSDAIVDALGSMGHAADSALPKLRTVLTMAPAETGVHVLAAIAHIAGTNALTLPAATAVLGRPERETLPDLFAALSAIKSEGRAAAAGIPNLAAIAGGKGPPWLRRAAIETLAATGPGGNRKAATALVAAASGKDAVISLDAETALGSFGTSADKVVPQLGELVAETPRARLPALRLLGMLGARAAPAVPELARVLWTEARSKRITDVMSLLLWTLRRMGPAGHAAEPTLTNLIIQEGGDPALTDGIRTPLLATLARIGVTPRVLPAIREMLRSNQAPTVACAAHAVGLIGRAAADTVPLLLRPLQPGFEDAPLTNDFIHGYVMETTARNECIRALGLLRSAARAALPLLRTYADAPASPDAGRRASPLPLREEAARAIRAIEGSRPARQ